MKTNNLPKLMVDSTESDAPAEIMMDYVISWSLRRADVVCKDEKPILYRYCRAMLAMLLDVELDATTTFESVETSKQYDGIDLWVELTLNRNGQRERHAILIEDKYYSKLRDTRDDDGEYRNQLEVYRKRFDGYYDEQPEQYHRHYALITCVDREDPKFAMYDIAPQLGYKTFSLGELLDENCNHELSESDIFNEFWILW